MSERCPHCAMGPVLWVRDGLCDRCTEEDAIRASLARAERERDEARRREERIKDRLARVLARAVVVMASAGNPTWNRKRHPNRDNEPRYYARGYVWSGRRYSWRSPKRIALSSGERK